MINILNSLNDYIKGHIRTYIPIIVGAALAYGETKWNIILGEDASTGLIVGLVGAVQAVYYTIVRALAEKWPVFGVLLVVNQAPNYADH